MINDNSTYRQLVTAIEGNRPDDIAEITTGSKDDTFYVDEMVPTSAPWLGMPSAFQQSDVAQADVALALLTHGQQEHMARLMTGTGELIGGGRPVDPLSEKSMLAWNQRMVSQGHDIDLLYRVTHIDGTLNTAGMADVVASEAPLRDRNRFVYQLATEQGGLLRLSDKKYRLDLQDRLLAKSSAIARFLGVYKPDEQDALFAELVATGQGEALAQMAVSRLSTQSPTRNVRLMEATSLKAAFDAVDQPGVNPSSRFRFLRALASEMIKSSLLVDTDAKLSSFKLDALLPAQRGALMKAVNAQMRSQDQWVEFQSTLAAGQSQEAANDIKRWSLPASIRIE